MNFIATALVAFLAAAAVAEAEETRRLGSKTSKATTKSGKGGSYNYNCSVSTKSGKGSKGSSKGGKGSYSYSMSYPSSCEELDSRFQPVYIVNINDDYRVERGLQGLDGYTFLSDGPVSEECALWIACDNGNTLVPPESLEQLLVNCYNEPAPEENLNVTNPVYIFDGPCQECGPKPAGCEIYVPPSS